MNILLYAGQEINQRDDSFINLTQMAKANDARLDNWLASPKTQDLLKALQESDSPESRFSGKVIETTATGFPAVKTTWGSPEVAIAFGQWISSAFYAWCLKNIRTLLETGKTELAPQQPERALPPVRDAKDYFDMFKEMNLLGDLNLMQLVRDKAEDELSAGRAKAIAPARPIEYTIGKVRATELGYTLQQIGNGSQLGKYLKKNVPIAYAQRIGKYDVNHYEVNNALDTAIHTFFGMEESLAA